MVNYTAYANLDTVDVYTLTDVTIHNITGGWGPEYIPFLYTNNKPGFNTYPFILDMDVDSSIGTSRSLYFLPKMASNLCFLLDAGRSNQSRSLWCIVK